jgi:hypothetical protein
LIHRHPGLRGVVQLEGGHQPCRWRSRVTPGDSHASCADRRGAAARTHPD